MGQLFHFDSPIVQIINKIVDLIILNILFILCCIPFVTIGAAQTALYTAIRKRIFDDNSLWSTYWRSFLSNLKQASILWMVMVANGSIGILGMNYYLASNSDFFLVVIHGILLLLWGSVDIWGVILQERFDNTIKHTLYNAFLCALSQCPRTIIALIIKSIPVILFLFYPSIFLYLLPFFLLLWFSLSYLILLCLFKKPISSMEHLASNHE